MTINIEGMVINRMQVIDDNPMSRETWGEFVTDLELDFLPEAGPIRNLDDFSKKVIENADAVLCDHHLKVGPYSRFNGAEVVNFLFRNGTPSILCTRFEERIEEIRKFRKYIPVLLNPKELNPDSIYEGIKTCVMEMKGITLPSRKAWRALVRIEDIDKEINPRNPFVEFTMPAWDSSSIIRLLFNDIPVEIRDNLQPGSRCHVMSNIGAERQEDLYFDGWEAN